MTAEGRAFLPNKVGGRNRNVGINEFIRSLSATAGLRRVTIRIYPFRNPRIPLAHVFRAVVNRAPRALYPCITAAWEPRRTRMRPNRYALTRIYIYILILRIYAPSLRVSLSGYLDYSVIVTRSTSDCRSERINIVAISICNSVVTSLDLV